MGIVRVGMLTAVAAAARLLSGFVIIKLVAIFSGPEGVAKLGQFMSLMALLVVFAGGGIGPGIVKYVSEYREDPEKLRRLLNAGAFFTLLASCFMGIAVLYFSRSITIGLLGDIHYISLIWVLAFAQISVAFHNLIVAIINGMMDIRRLAIIHVAGAIIGLIITALLGFYFKLYGVLLAFILGQAVLVFISFFLFRRNINFNWQFFRPQFDLKNIKLLSRFALMTLTSALLAPLVQIIVRNYLASEFSWTETGYWQSVSKVSEAYLLFITMAINVYYLPKLSVITDRRKFKEELVSAYRYLMPVVIFSALSIYFLRDYVTAILFTKDFSQANYLYAPQLVGDVIKIASFILSYIMLAKALTMLFFLSELAFSAMYIGWVWFLTSHFGLIGAMYAFIINYVFYFIFTIIVAKRFIKDM
jgi:polysaccharide transporter, PST family